MNMTAGRPGKGSELPLSRLHDPFRSLDDAVFVESPRAVTRREDGDVAKRVVVVDDEAKIVDVGSGYLRAAGFSVTTASDGAGAIASARALDGDLPLVATAAGPDTAGFVVDAIDPDVRTSRCATP
jgi:hypothetical protein